MFGNAAPTPYDLRFSLFGIPVRVHPLFWLVSALFAWHPRDFNVTLLAIACVFVSILVHELGHALTAAYFGWPPEIVLYSFGGFASFVPTWGYTTGRSILISLAGPGAGFALFGVVLGVEAAIGQANNYVYVVLGYMKFINLWWGLVNLLPVYPLDGGRVARDLLTHLRPRSGLDISLKLSLLVAASAAVLFFMKDQTWPGILFAVLAFESLQHLQGPRYR